MKKTTLLSRLFGDDGHFERPFFLFLTLVLVGMYVWALTDSPNLDSIWKIILFTILMNVQIALYWVSPWIYEHPRWIAPYMVIQGLLSLAMGLLVRVVGFVFGIYPGLVGLMIGMPTRRVWRVLAVAYVMALSLFNYIAVTGLGATLWWVLGMVPVVLFVMMYVLMYLRQTEARLQAQSLLRDLEAANQQLREYAARVEDLTIESERQRMARELHDTLSQGLAGLILQLEAADAHLEGGRAERARTIVRQAMEKARAALAEARQAIDDLRQPEGRDLAEVVRQEAERFTKATGIQCQTQVELPHELPEAFSEAAARAVSESLTNVARHAHAKQVDIRIASMAEQDKRNELTIEIKDDGVGFDPAAVEAGHYGLLGMRERVRLAGGSLEVRSAAAQGTQVMVRFPLEKSADE